MNPANNETNHYSISRVASIFSVSTHTLRNLERDLTGNRIYSQANIDEISKYLEYLNFQKASETGPKFKRDIIKHQNNPLVVSYKKPLVAVLSLLAIFVLLASYSFGLIGKHSLNGKTYKVSSNSDPKVLGIQDSAEGTLYFNSDSVFNKNISTLGALDVAGLSTFGDNIEAINHNLTLGGGLLAASNVIYGIKAGTNVSVSTGQTPTIGFTGVSALQGKTGSVKLGRSDTSFL